MSKIDRTSIKVGDDIIIDMNGERVECKVLRFNEHKALGINDVKVEFKHDYGYWIGNTEWIDLNSDRILKHFPKQNPK